MNTVEFTVTVKITMPNALAKTNIAVTSASAASNNSSTNSIVPAPNDTKICEVKENKDTVEVVDDEYEEDGEPKEVVEAKSEELKIATQEEINDIKHAAAVNRTVKNFRWHFMSEIKNITIESMFVVGDGGIGGITKDCIKIPMNNTAPDSYVLQYMTNRYGYDDFKKEKSRARCISYRYYSFATTVEANYKQHMNKANQKKRILEEIDKEVSDLLREKRRRLA